MQITAPFFFSPSLGLGRKGRKNEEEAWPWQKQLSHPLCGSTWQLVSYWWGWGVGAVWGRVVFGKAATSTRLSEWMCNYAEHPFRMSDHLGVDGSYKSEHTHHHPHPRVCHDATVCVSHHAVKVRRGDCGGGGTQRGREREDSGFCCLRAGGHLPFMPSLKPHQGISRALTLALREPPSTPTPNLPPPH